jgi:hypothetical protein
MPDFSDHSLLQIGTWTEVAILLFMLWEHYGPHLRAEGMTKAIQVRPGFWPSLWENRTLVATVIGLGIVAWLHLAHFEQAPGLKMNILSVVFPQTQPSELIVTVHLANPGPPSTVIAALSFMLMVIYSSSSPRVKSPLLQHLAPTLGWGAGLPISGDPSCRENR